MKNTKSNIQKQFEEFMKFPFPSEAHIEGAEFELADTFAAGCIMTSIRSGKLSKKHKKILLKIKKDLLRDLGLLPLSAKPYFNSLLEIIDLALQNNFSGTSYPVTVGQNLFIPDGIPPGLIKNK